MTRHSIYREIYEKQLTTLVKNMEGVLVLPVKNKVSRAIFSLGDYHNDDIGFLIEDYLNNNKKVWIWSDLHFNHKNICEHAGRPFKSLEEMHSSMIKGYYSVVKEDDLVIFGGDIAFGDFDYINELITNMPGKKALIIGNHDFNFKTMEPIKYTCFDYINSFAHFNYSIDSFNTEVVITHYPLQIKDLPLNVLNIHGHTHNILMGEKRINMCVEYTDYKPKSLHSFFNSTL